MHNKLTEFLITMKYIKNIKSNCLIIISSFFFYYCANIRTQNMLKEVRSNNYENIYIKALGDTKYNKDIQYIILQFVGTDKDHPHNVRDFIEFVWEYIIDNNEDPYIEGLKCAFDINNKIVIHELPPNFQIIDLNRFNRSNFISNFNLFLNYFIKHLPSNYKPLNPLFKNEIDIANNKEEQFRKIAREMKNFLKDFPLINRDIDTEQYILKAFNEKLKNENTKRCIIKIKEGIIEFVSTDVIICAFLGYIIQYIEDNHWPRNHQSFTQKMGLSIIAILGSIFFMRFYFKLCVIGLKLYIIGKG